MTVDQKRRTVLGSIATTAAGLAGCLGGSWTNEESQSTSSFGDVHVDGESLVVQLSEDATLDRVNVIAPDGEQFASKQVAAGATQVRIPLGVEYTPGDNRIVGVTDDAQVAETTLTITPDVQITMVGVGANHAEKMPQDLEYAEQQALIRLENKGNGPEAILKLLILGDVPNPTEDLKNQDSSGIYDASDGFGAASAVSVPGEGEIELYSTSMPFVFSGKGGVQCQESTQEGRGTVNLQTKFQKSISKAFRARYTASESSDGCQSKVLELL